TMTRGQFMLTLNSFWELNFYYCVLFMISDDVVVMSDSRYCYRPIKSKSGY
ncbi:MAG: hypothetical protein ACI94L_000775, partial [Flavobacteriaceae bacterium]